MSIHLQKYKTGWLTTPFGFAPDRVFPVTDNISVSIINQPSWLDDATYFDVSSGRAFVTHMSAVCDKQDYLNEIKNDQPFLDYLETVRNLPGVTELPPFPGATPPSTDPPASQPESRPPADDVYEKDGVMYSPNHVILQLDDYYWSDHSEWTQKRFDAGFGAGMNRIEELSKRLTEEADREREEREERERKIENNEP